MIFKRKEITIRLSKLENPQPQFITHTEPYHHTRRFIRVGGVVYDLPLLSNVTVWINLEESEIWKQLNN